MPLNSHTDEHSLDEHPLDEHPPANAARGRWYPGGWLVSRTLTGTGTALRRGAEQNSPRRFGPQGR